MANADGIAPAVATQRQRNVTEWRNVTHVTQAAGEQLLARQASAARWHSCAGTAPYSRLTDTTPTSVGELSIRSGAGLP